MQNGDLLHSVYQIAVFGQYLFEVPVDLSCHDTGIWNVRYEVLRRRCSTIDRRASSRIWLIGDGQHPMTVVVGGPVVIQGHDQLRISVSRNFTGTSNVNGQVSSARDEAVSD
jgi:hypothetical protein